jgi:hypothetical protein
MKEENSFLVVTTLLFTIIAAFLCAYEWFYGNQEYALILTAGSAIAIPFFAVIVVLRQIKKNQTILKEKLGKLEAKIEQIEKQEEA